MIYIKYSMLIACGTGLRSAIISLSLHYLLKTCVHCTSTWGQRERRIIAVKCRSNHWAGNFKTPVQCTLYTVQVSSDCFYIVNFLLLFPIMYTDKKESKIFLIYKEIQKGAVAKSFMTNFATAPI
jgi:hypothetical protein